MTISQKIFELLREKGMSQKDFYIFQGLRFLLCLHILRLLRKHLRRHTDSILRWKLIVLRHFCHRNNEGSQIHDAHQF